MDFVLKFLTWTVILIISMIVIGGGVIAYQIISFDTDTLPENHGNVDAQLFVGEGENLPLLVGFGGAEGGNSWANDYWTEQREEFLSQGYAFLALGYFGSENTPRALDRIALDGVYQAIEEAASNPNINEDCIAVIGGSKGAELALLLASEFPQIKSVVALVPGKAVFAALTFASNTSSFSLNGKPFEFVPVPWSAVPDIFRGDLRAVWEKSLENDVAVQKSLIPIEKINGPIYFVSATNDELWPSKEMSDDMMEYLADKNFPYHSEHLAVEGTHAAPLTHFDEIETFLKVHFLSENTQNCPRTK